MNVRFMFLNFLLIGLISTTFTVSASAAPSSKTLSIAIIQEWSAFNPITNQLASNEALFPFILRRMVKRTASGGVLPDVAESVPRLASNRKATWTIRANAQWGDGTPMSCADWYLGWQAGLNPKVSVETRNFYDKIEKLEWDEKSPRVCHITYKTASWSNDRDLPPLLPSHLEKQVYEKFKNEPEGYDRNTVYISNPTEKGLYNGPYYVSEFKLGSYVIFSRNEHFYGHRPQLDKIIVKLITDTSALKANLLSGQVNAISAVGFPPDTAFLFDDEFHKNNSPYVVHFQSSGIFQGLYFNLESPVFTDQKVREALSRTIDKQKIVKAFFDNKLEAAETILSPQHPAYAKKSPIYSRDLANKILDEDGWKKNPSTGVREKNGKPLSFVFKTSAGLKVLENIQVYICEQYKYLGAQCQIKNEPPRVLLGQSVPHGEYDLSMFGQPIPPDTSITSYFSSSDIPTAKNSWAGSNQIRLSSPELDKLLQSFDNEASVSKRNQIIKKIESYLQIHYSMIPLYHRREAIVMPKGLAGLTDSYEGTGFNDPENWIWK